MSVYRDVTVVYDLARHSAAAAEAEAINNVIEAAFDKNEHVFARYAAHSFSLVVVHFELFFKNAVDKFNLLFLFELQSVVALFLSGNFNLTV